MVGQVSARQRREWAAVAQSLADALRGAEACRTGDSARAVRTHAEFALSMALGCAGCPSGDTRLDVMRACVAGRKTVTDALREAGC
jgi:hypothetical protein